MQPGTAHGNRLIHDPRSLSKRTSNGALRSYLATGIKTYYGRYTHWMMSAVRTVTSFEIHKKHAMHRTPLEKPCPSRVIPSTHYSEPTLRAASSILVCFATVASILVLEASRAALASPKSDDSAAN